MTVEWDVDSIIENVTAASLVGVANGIEAIRANALKKIQEGSKTGRIYKRRSVVHTASAPGEPPASDTGRLVQSGRTELFPEKGFGLVIFSTAYAAALEFGREDGSILPRPYLRPALAEEREAIEKDTGDQVRGVLA